MSKPTTTQIKKARSFVYQYNKLEQKRYKYESTACGNFITNPAIGQMYDAAMAVRAKFFEGLEKGSCSICRKPVRKGSKWKDARSDLRLIHIPCYAAAFPDRVKQEAESAKTRINVYL